MMRSDPKLKMFPKMRLLFPLVALVVFFQNCSGLNFVTKMIQGQSDAESNGGGYTGLQPKSFFRLVPGFTCETNGSAVSALEVHADSAVFTENRRLECGAIKKTVDRSLIDFSVYQSDIIGYRDGIYEGRNQAPTQIPSDLVEVWCRNTIDQTGIETIMHFNRATNTAMNRVYYATHNPNATYTKAVIPDANVSRVVGEKTVTLQSLVNGLSIFDLTVHRDQPATSVGLFQAQMSVVINGQRISHDTSCRLGGLIDAKLWPARQLFDYGIINVSVSPEANTLVFSSSDGSATNIYSSTSDGAVMKNLTHSPSGMTVNSDFTLDSVGRMVGYELDNIISGSALTFNSVALSGGAPVILNPTSNTTMGVVPISSKTKNKFLFNWGIGLPQSPDIFSVNADGTGLINITPTFIDPNETYFSTNAAPGMQVEDYILAYSLVNHGPQMNSYAVAIDGSGSQALSPLKFWAVNGRFAFGVDASGTRHEVVDLKTANRYEPSFDSAASDNATLFYGTKATADGKALTAIAMSLANGNEFELCPAVTASKMKLQDLGEGSILILAFEPGSAQDLSPGLASGHLAVYRANGGKCSLVNSTLITNSKLNMIQNVVVSADRQKIALLMLGYVGPVSELLYIPLNGQASYIVNTPVFETAEIYSAVFLNDSQSIVYVGDQITAGISNVFLWKAPDSAIAQ